MIAPIASRNASTDCLDVPGALLARRRSPRETCEARLRLRLHRVLENLDGAGQRADLVGAVGVRHHDILGAVGDLLDGRGDGGEGTGDRAGDDDDADHDQRPAPRRRGRSGRRRAMRLVVGLLRDAACRVRHRPWRAPRDPCSAPSARRGWRRCRPIRGPRPALISTPRRTSSLRNSTNCSMRFLKVGELLGIVGLDDASPSASPRRGSGR